MTSFNPATGILFAKVEQRQTLSQLLAEVAQADLQIAPEVDRWLHWGCVYVDGIRQRADLSLAVGQVVRFHSRLKRYLGQVEDWSDRLIENNSEFLIFNKPSGMPTHPTLDNYVENAKTFLESKLNIPLYTTHRLDIPTRGLLIFGKTQKALSGLNKLFRIGKVQKHYRVWTDRPVPLGHYTHFINPETHVPRQIDTLPHDNWWRCELIVESVQSCANSEHRHLVQLLTGKTHQIRAQFAALSAPVIGDTVYGGRDGSFGLECFSMSFGRQTYTLRSPDGLA
jgi:23S rRNA pseudouridine1911/1915/1917 synthase